MAILWKLFETIHEGQSLKLRSIYFTQYHGIFYGPGEHKNIGRPFFAFGHEETARNYAYQFSRGVQWVCMKMEVAAEEVVTPLFNRSAPGWMMDVLYLPDDTEMVTRLVMPKAEDLEFAFGMFNCYEHDHKTLELIAKAVGLNWRQL